MMRLFITIVSIHITLVGIVVTCGETVLKNYFF